MTHIDKNQPISQEGRACIQNWLQRACDHDTEKKNEIYLKESYKTKTGSKLWELMTDKKPLKRFLVLEQGFVCCYCGRRIFKDHNTLIEHLEPKGEAKSKIYVYAYNNLMACCKGSSEKLIHIVKGSTETIESVAERYAIPVTQIETLYVDDKNYQIVGKAYDIEKLQVGDKILIIQPLDVEYQHCGPKKADWYIEVHPIQADCASQFKYKQYTQGTNKDKAEVIADGANETAQSTIDILNLNGNDALNRERYATIEKTLLVRNKIMNSAGDKRALLNKQIQSYERASDKNAPQGEVDASYFKQPFWFVRIAVLKFRLLLS